MHTHRTPCRLYYLSAVRHAANRPQYSECIVGVVSTLILTSQARVSAHGFRDPGNPASGEHFLKVASLTINYTLNALKRTASTCELS